MPRYPRLNHEDGSGNISSRSLTGRAVRSRVRVATASRCTSSSGLRWSPTLKAAKISEVHGRRSMNRTIWRSPRNAFWYIPIRGVVRSHPDQFVDPRQQSRRFIGADTRSCHLRGTLAWQPLGAANRRGLAKQLRSELAPAPAPAQPRRHTHPCHQPERFRPFLPLHSKRRSAARPPIGKRDVPSLMSDLCGNRDQSPVRAAGTWRGDEILGPASSPPFQRA
jgi:hypothetical protein